MKNKIHNSKSFKKKILALAELLENTKWANDFSWEQICTICEHVNAVKAQEGTVVFKEGNVETSMGIIVKGSIDIYKKDNQELKKITTLQSAQTFGEMALIDDEPRSATGIAHQNSIIFFISRTELIIIANKNPKLGFKMLWQISKIISQRLRSTTGKLIDYM